MRKKTRTEAQGRGAQNSPGNRLRRVIRRLPILGAVPQQDRLGPLLAIRYPNHAPLSQNSNGRTPALPLDFYLIMYISVFYSVYL